MSDVQQPGASSIGTYIAAGAVAVAIGAGAWVSLEVGSRMEGVNPQLAWDAPETLGQLVRGALTWPLASTLIMAGIVLVVALLATLVAVLLGRSKAKRTRVDAAARRMGRGRDITGLSYKNAQQVAQRLGIEGPVGIPLGKAVDGGQPLYASYEDMITMIAGPRVGKSTSLVIPALLEAPGFALVTSNKRDVLDATRLLRGERGRVWVFDPQGVAAEPATWYWNPLSYVTDDEKAAKLAEHFASGSRKPGARTDAYFDPAGQDLLAGMLLAAALDGREITDVYRWLADDGNREPATILRESTYPLVADAVLGVMGLEAKQRGGHLRHGHADGVLAQELENRHLGHARRRARGVPTARGGAVDGHALQPLEGGCWLGGPARARPDSSRRRGSRGVRGHAAGRPPAGADGRHPRRGRERLPLGVAARPLLALRLARHQPGYHPAVLVAGRRRVVAVRHAQAVERVEREDLRRRRR